MNIKDFFTKTLEQAEKLLQSLRRYQTIIFIVFLAVLYGILIFRVNTLSNKQPSDNDISLQLKASSSPRIDQKVVDKIKNLQDNSVQVKTLFNDARNNPFSE